MLIKINLLIVYLDYAKSLSENSKTSGFLGGTIEGAAEEHKSQRRRWQLNEEAKKAADGPKNFFISFGPGQQNGQLRLMGTRG